MSTELINNVQEFVKSRLQNQGAGHGWDHVQRVVGNAKRINQEVKADAIIVELAALLHDIGDAKFNNGQEVGPTIIAQELPKLGADEATIKRVCEIVEKISFRKATSSDLLSLEAKVVQDADRLDALGYIGLVRCIEYVTQCGRKFFDPAIKVRENMTPEEYAAHDGTGYNHCYEKLFKLKDLMNTDSARKIATSREIRMRSFLAGFIEEINGNA